MRSAVPNDTAHGINRPAVVLADLPFEILTEDRAFNADLSLG
ncbi:MAG: hypothetical protein OXF74_13930 [Rhodobacteraceae bacterium]|nr:hypothetical protein [Paracoccaceae bacterium]